MKPMFYLLSLLILFSCGGSSEESTTTKSAEKKIIEFKIEQDHNAMISIDEANKSVSAIVTKTVDLSSVMPTIKVSDKASVNPRSGIVQNFQDGRTVSYTVYAEDDSSEVYKVRVSHTPNSEKQMLSFFFPDMYRQATISGNSIEIAVPYGTDLKNLMTKGELSPGATAQPQLGQTTNFSTPVTYTITAEDKSITQYNVQITVEAQETAIRAVWIPDPSHTNCMRTYQNVKKTVELLDNLNFNTIYVATWVRTQTAWDSQVLLDNSNHASKADGNFFSTYKATYNYPETSPTCDPLKDLLTEAHKKGIKVIFWFEYGFMANGGAGNIPTVSNNKIMAKNPTWIGRGNAGEVSNYNNSDFYFNGYDPQVQEFIIKLIEESITLYPEVDGIQGDDRMPAMPRNSGYEPATIARYKAENEGSEPPQDINSAAWVSWRINILNTFGKTLDARVKAKKSSALVCFSPNPYPWCEDNLMQQWPTWLKDGIVDILSVQCYRNDESAYRATVSSVKGYVTANTSKKVLNPGMILKNGATIMSETLLLQQLNVNRERETMGEAYFFIDGLNDANVQKVFKAYYPGKAKFPY